MKKSTAVVAVFVVLAVAGFLLLFGTRHSFVQVSTGSTNEIEKIFPPVSSSTTPIAKTNSLERATTNLPASTVATVPQFLYAMRTESVPSASEFTNLPPQIVMENVRTVFRTYQSMFRENPVGTNPEITHALDGGNRKQAHFLSEADGLRVNGSGELIDSWGTPFFFHQLSGNEMEIHSAGPDRVMWTKDDLETK